MWSEVLEQSLQKVIHVTALAPLRLVKLLVP